MCLDVFQSQISPESSMDFSEWLPFTVSSERSQSCYKEHLRPHSLQPCFNCSVVFSSSVHVSCLSSSCIDASHYRQQLWEPSPTSNSVLNSILLFNLQPELKFPAVIVLSNFLASEHYHAQIYLHFCVWPYTFHLYDSVWPCAFYLHVVKGYKS